jgi:hypothetical protein
VGSGSVHGGRARVRGAWMSGGIDDPNVCGLWFQESLPLCMILSFLCSFTFPIYFEPGVVL